MIRQPPSSYGGSSPALRERSWSTVSLLLSSGRSTYSIRRVSRRRYADPCSLTAWPSRFRGSLRAGTSRSRSVRTQLGAPLLNRSVIWETDCPTAVLHRHPLAFGREFPWSLSTGPSHRPQGPQLSHCSRTTTPDAPCHGTVTSRPLASQKVCGRWQMNQHH